MVNIFFVVLVYKLKLYRYTYCILENKSAHVHTQWHKCFNSLPSFSLQRLSGQKYPSFPEGFTQWEDKINFNTTSMFPALIVSEWKCCSMPAFCSISSDNSASNRRSSPDMDSVRMGWRSRTSLALELVPDLHSLLFPVFSRIFVVLLDHCHPYCVRDLFHFPTSRLHKNINTLKKKKPAGNLYSKHLH